MFQLHTLHGQPGRGVVAEGAVGVWEGSGRSL